MNCSTCPDMKADAGPTISRKSVWLPIILIIGVALSYAVYTGHIWEDYYITYRSSKNLATGSGLVYQPGERVHVFTSPLNVLIPAGICWLIGDRSDLLVIWIFRIISLGLLAGVWVILNRVLRRWRISRLPVLFLLLLLAFESKIVAFSMNGQEAALMIFFLTGLTAALEAKSRRWVYIGLIFAGLMYCRPDGFIYGGAYLLAFLIFPTGEESGAARKNLLRDVFRGGLLSLILYSPWLIWSTWYYGSPIPHTVVAKGDALGRSFNFWQILSTLIRFPLDILLHQIGIVFNPIYAGFGGWPRFVNPVSSYITLIGALYWIFPFGSRPARRCSLAFFLCLYYIDRVVPFPYPWYLPFAALFGIIVLALIAEDLIGPLRSRRFVRPWLQISSLVTMAIIAVGIASLFALTAYQMRIQQREIENGIRATVGTWLKVNARTPDDTVFLEPLGYIGFFSGLKMYDEPGLSSPEVVAARKKVGGQQVAPVIRELTPDWLVLRPTEVNQLYREDSSLLKEAYRLEEKFDARPRLRDYRWIPGIGYLYRDSVFHLYRRRNF